MKKLGKLSINPEKIIKNEELLNLKGGSGNAILKCCDGDDGYACTLAVTDCGSGSYDSMLRQYCLMYCESAGATGDWECVE